MSYNLFLDDDIARKPSAFHPNLLVEWTFARSYAEFVRIVTGRGKPLRVSFDHDLHESHYKLGQESGFKTFDYTQCTVETGYHAAVWFALWCAERNMMLPEVYVHTMNPIGKINIRKLVDFCRVRSRMNLASINEADAAIRAFEH